MTKIEPAVIRSFRNVKSDVVRLQGDLLYLSEKQEQLIEDIKELSAKLAAKKTINKVHRRQFVASKMGKKFHSKNCPFAKNIKPSRKIVFHSKIKALNEGFKPCTCVA